MANVTDLFSFYQCSQLVDRNRRRFFIDDLEISISSISSFKPHSGLLNYPCAPSSE